MEYVLCCLCCIICFICGVWAARGFSLPHKAKKYIDKTENVQNSDDLLSRDIAAMLAYTIPSKEENNEEITADI